METFHPSEISRQSSRWFCGVIFPRGACEAALVYLSPKLPAENTVFSAKVQPDIHVSSVRQRSTFLPDLYARRSRKPHHQAARRRRSLARCPPAGARFSQSDDGNEQLAVSPGREMYIFCVRHEAFQSH